MDASQTISEIFKEAMRWVDRYGNVQQHTQLDELYHQYRNRHFQIAFNGHFSAGKSSLINAICRKELLPSGPIPTTANIIRIQAGPEEKVELFHRDEKGKLVSARKQIGTMEDLAAYTTEDTEYDSVTIEAPLPDWEEGLVFVDTPGADSTDERHHQATERVLPLADLVLYVTDYNHVLSEVNMLALQRLQAMNKKFVFIINQVDKHREEELSFVDFQQSVTEALLDWKVSPEHLWFVSVRKPHHPKSEWAELEQWLQAVAADKERLREGAIRGSLATLIQEYSDQNEVQFEEQKSALQATTQIPLSTLITEMSGRQTEEKAMLAYPEQRENEVKHELASILKNANIIPAQTRELAHEFLQTREPGFQKGWLFSKKKTEQAQSERLEEFHKAFQENIRTQLESHLKGYLRGVVASIPNSERYLHTLDEILLIAEPSWLVEQIQAGVLFNNEYTMTYMTRVSDAAKAKIRQQLFAFVSELRQEWEKEAQHKLAQIQQQLQQGEQAREIYDQWLKLNEQQQQMLIELESLLKKGSIHTKEFSLPGKPDRLQQSYETTGSLDVNKMESLFDESDDHLDERSAVIREGNHTKRENNTTPAQMNYNWKKNQEVTANKLEIAANILKSVPGFADTAARMEAKAKQFSDSQFTVALFGAFSAGKSSFANALAGDTILAVSPHPTTAAITRMLAPTAEHPHGTAEIKLKSEERLQQEVQQAVLQQGKQWDEQMRLATWMNETVATTVQSDGARRSHAFLKAVQSGWPQLKTKLGQTLQVDLAEFRRFSAEEMLSVYVDSIDLYYRSALTEAGVILVDTPGADSLNARHTGVAFEYIKDADAILYVTYYNHAFSQADQMFLEQLGNVKDQFTLDKMFFIINAADLASDKAELDIVKQHVQTNLEKSGIRQARLYTLSSMEALKAKQTNHAQLLAQSGLSLFEQDWLQFMQNDIAAMASQSVNHDLDQAIAWLEQWNEEAQGTEADNAQKRLEWKQARSEAVALFESSEADELIAQANREINDLIYYVKQRLHFRFGDWFKQAFHPSSFQNTTRAAIRTSLIAAMNDLTQTIEKACIQEALTASLRVEKYMQGQWNAWDGNLLKKVDHLYARFQAELLLEHRWETPRFTGSFPRPEIDERWLLSRFQNARTFFEQGGRDGMRSDLEKEYRMKFDQMMDQLGEELKHHSENEIQKQFALWKKERIEALTAYAAGWIETLSDSTGREIFGNAKQQLVELNYEPMK